MSENVVTDTETIVCDFCGGKDSTVFFVENGCNLTRCGSCGLLYVNPRPLSSQGFARYSHEYTDYVEKYIQNMERNGLVVEKSERIPLFSLFFSKDNLRLFKGSKLKSALKSTLLAVPPMRQFIVALFNLYYVRLKKNKVCKLRIVARKT